ncbi:MULTISPECIES: hypothetical protein [unclassified Acinetobacter]|uniref:hypothetical protein n=1 Tax=unclassified Acinetobacter TaxID=196816 RepID=UPI0025773D8F|nr:MULTISPECIES: hypothetical protein [unclassified Acinetobacter]MDM1765540.1 hypothetical protein [Acinetobacter sp. 226-1]MDM1769132.1 hypothetical protein [Acinetobacter sp. 226-4]
MFSLNKSFIVLLFFSTFLAFVVNFGILAYGPFLLLGFFVICNNFFKTGTLSKKDFYTFIGITPFILLCLSSYILHPYQDKFFNTHILALLVIYPLIVSIQYVNTLSDDRRVDFLYNLLKYFIYFQIFVCVGQALNYIVGIGFYIPEEFRDSKMIPGTFANANDLATVLVLILYSILNLEKSLSGKKFVFLIILIFILIIICASRVALILSILLFIFRSGFNFYKFLKSFLILALSGLMLVVLAKTIMGDTFNRALLRLEAIKDIATQGFSSDNSASIRTLSYEFFLNNLGQLGFGTFEVNNYSTFANTTDASYINELMFQNPHSLIVEVGYWLGYIGLIFLSLFIFSLIKNHNKNKFLLLFLFLTLTNIPSSILGNFLFFSFFVLTCIFKYPKTSDFRNE